MNTRLLLFLMTLLVAPVVAQADVSVTLIGTNKKEVYQWQIFNADGNKVSSGTNGRKNPFSIPTAMFGRVYKGPYKIVIFEYVGGPDERGRFKTQRIGQGTLHRAAGKISIKCN